MAHRGLILYSYTEDGIELCDASFIRTDCYCPEIIGEVLLKSFNSPAQARAIARFGYMPTIAEDMDALTRARKTLIENNPDNFAHIAGAGLSEAGIPYSRVTKDSLHGLIERAEASCWIEAMFGWVKPMPRAPAEWCYTDFARGFWPEWTLLSSAIKQDKARWDIRDFVAKFHKRHVKEYFHVDYGKHPKYGEWRDLDAVRAGFTTALREKFGNLSGYPGVYLTFANTVAEHYFEIDIARWVKAALPTEDKDEPPPT